MPVRAQMGWFRLRYPMGRIETSVLPEGSGAKAKARIYPDYKDSPEHFLSEATATRYPLADKPEISPAEWAQTAAIGIALRNAGFGLQFDAAGEAFEPVIPDEAPEKEESTGAVSSESSIKETGKSEMESDEPVQTEEPIKEMTLDEAYKVTCPLKKHPGKTLGEVLLLEPQAIQWLADKYEKDQKIKEAARLICRQARQAS